MYKSDLQDFQVDEAPAEVAVAEYDPESSTTPEDDAGPQNTHVSSLPSASETQSETVHVSEDLSSTATVSPGPRACRSEACNSSA